MEYIFLILTPLSRISSIFKLSIIYLPIAQSKDFQNKYLFCHIFFCCSIPLNSIFISHIQSLNLEILFISGIFEGFGGGLFLRGAHSLVPNIPCYKPLTFFHIMYLCLYLSVTKT